MKILVLNSGSSSIKFKLYEMTAERSEVLAAGLVERIGEDVGKLKYVRYEDGAETAKREREEAVADHAVGLEAVIADITDAETGVIAATSEIEAVGHRVVHGGEAFSAPTVVDDAVEAAIEQQIPLAPLHNPANLTGVRVARRLIAHAPQVAVFDTAFHQTMPPKAYMYALPYELYEQHGVRKYGFHGASHQYVARKTASLIGKPADACNIITAHLGNGASMAAVENGRCVDTTLGMTPLAGLIMGTRTGDFDPAILFYLARTMGMSLDELDAMVNKQSGLKGVCGANDLRDIHAMADKGEAKAKLALEMLAYRNRKYFGAFFAVLGKVDAIAYTAGVGENDAWVRLHSLAGLEPLGVVVDPQLNDNRFSEPARISAPESAVQVWVTPTDEELEIANQTMDVLRQGTVQRPATS